MKRSELLNVIRRSLRGLFDSKEETEETEENSEKLLCTIEEAFKQTPPKVVTCSVLHTKKFVWEPETFNVPFYRSNTPLSIPNAAITFEDIQNGYDRAIEQGGTYPCRGGHTISSKDVDKRTASCIVCYREVQIKD